MYHDLRDDEVTFTATILRRRPDSPVNALHVAFVDGQPVGEQHEVVVSPLDFDQSAGSLNALTVTTNDSGTRLEINGSLVLEVPSTDLWQVQGRMQVCAGIMREEQHDYLIDYIDLRAWTE